MPFKVSLHNWFSGDFSSTLVKVGLHNWFSGDFNSTLVKVSLRLDTGSLEFGNMRFDGR